jgi:hypothetical protein
VRGEEGGKGEKRSGKPIEEGREAETEREEDRKLREEEEREAI